MKNLIKVIMVIILLAILGHSIYKYTKIISFSEAIKPMNYDEITYIEVATAKREPISINDPNQIEIFLNALSQADLRVRIRSFNDIDEIYFITLRSDRETEDGNVQMILYDDHHFTLYKDYVASKYDKFIKYVIVNDFNNEFIRQLFK